MVRLQAMVRGIKFHTLQALFTRRFQRGLYELFTDALPTVGFIHHHGVDIRYTAFLPQVIHNGISAKSNYCSIHGGAKKRVRIGRYATLQNYIHLYLVNNLIRP